MEAKTNLTTDEAIFCGHLEPVDLDHPPAESGTPEKPGTPRGYRVGTNESDVQSLNPTGFSNFCQGYKDRVGTGCDDNCCFCGDGCGVCSQEAFPIFWNEAVRGSQWNPVETPEELCATIDTGCQRMAIGLNTSTSWTNPFHQVFKPN